MTYGKSAPTAIANPEFVRLCRVVDNFQSVIRPGAYLVDRVPLLRYLPGYGKQIYKWHNEELELFRYHLSRVKSEVVRGSLVSINVYHLYLITRRIKTKPTPL